MPGYSLLEHGVGGNRRGASARRSAALRGSRSWDAEFAWARLRGDSIVDFHRRTSYRFRAGMAVSDWPATFGYNMLLYPFAKMTGGVFYEQCALSDGLARGTDHVHAGRSPHGALPLRIGTLVLIWLVFVCVTVQGIMGGLRVTEKTSIWPSSTASSACRAGGHGVRGGLAVSEAAALLPIFAGHKTRTLVVWAKAKMGLSRSMNRRVPPATRPTVCSPRCWSPASCCKRCWARSCGRKRLLS